MIFRRYANISSQKNPEQLKAHFLGQHLKIHQLDFEIFEKDGMLKVIPHAEDDNHIYTLPITRLKFVSNGNGTTIKMLSKPRRIDIGGPYLLMIFILFALVASVLLYYLGEGQYNNTAYILSGIAIVSFIALWIRMEQGYFDYIRKIKKWVKQHA